MNRRKSRRGSRRFILYVLILCLLLAALAALLLPRVAAKKLQGPGDDAIDAIVASSSRKYTKLSLNQEDMYRGDLVLVNKDNPIAVQDQITLTQLRNEQAVATRCYPQLQAMMDDCRAQGLYPMICSSFRTKAKQEELFYNKVTRLIEEGYAPEDARRAAGREVALPGTSEHQLGLAVDICTESNQSLDTSQLESPVQQWLMANCHRYGFILRYGTDKSDLTGIIYEPWHYRFVDLPHSIYMAENGLCLEEYIALLRKYSVDKAHLQIDTDEGRYEVYFCPGLEVYVPSGEVYSISGNNVDGFIVTVHISAPTPPKIA